MPEKLSRLEAVELREIWPDEAADFTPWLAKEENLYLLADTLGLEFEFEAQEINVGNFRADILCKNEDGSRVLIENQLEATDHKHFGQILTYAAGLGADTVIWIAEKFLDEHRAALDQQNEMTDERFRYFGVEIKVWKIGDSTPAPQFEIVSSPNNWHHEVSHDAEREVNENLTETQQLQKKFWTELRAYMIEKHSSVKLRKPRASNHISASIGRTHFGIAAYIENRVIIYIEGQDAEAHFHLLKEKQEEIESEFGESLEWEERPERKDKYISLSKSKTDLTDEAGWPNQHKWLASKLELFDKVFRPRIKALNADDWEPPEDENEA